MPLRIVNIPTSTSPYEAAAQLFTELTYVAAVDARAMRFQLGLSKWAIVAKSDLCQSWSLKLQPIRPVVAAADFDTTEFRKGLKLLNERLLVAQYILAPRLIETARKRPFFVDGFAPTQENMALLVLQALGRKDSSVPNVKDRMWRPSRPVIHLALGLTHWFAKKYAHVSKTGVAEPGVRILVDFFFSEGAVAEVVKSSELFRRGLPSIERLNFRDCETIRFTATDAKPFE